MNNAVDSTQTLPTVQIDPDQWFAGVVNIDAYHAETKRTDYNARLYITISGGLEVHLQEGVYPIRAAYDLLSGKRMRVESDEFEVVEIEGEEQPRTQYKAVFVHVPATAFKVAMEFAKQISSPPTAQTKVPNEVNVWQLPITLWGAHLMAERGDA